MKELNLDNMIRTAVKKSGVSQYRIALDSGLSQGAVSKFLSGKTLTLRSAGRLLAALDIRVELTQGTNHGKRN